MGLIESPKGPLLQRCISDEAERDRNNDSNPARFPGMRNLFTVGCLALLTAVLGAFALGVKSLSHDEAFSIAMASLGLSRMFELFTIDESFNALYYLLLHVWIYGGTSENWTRLPSVLFGVLAVIDLFALNRRLFGSSTATVASVLLAVNPFFVAYEQDARPYTLTVFLTVLATHTFVLAVERPSLRRWTAYGVISALLIYARIFAALILPAHVLSLALRGDRPARRYIVAGYGLAAALVIPLVAALLASPRRGIPLVSPVTLDSFNWVFISLTGGAGVAGWNAFLLLLLYFALCCWTVFVIVRALFGSQARRTKSWSYLFMVVCLIVPVIEALFVSRVLVYPRYLIFIIGPLVTCAAIGIATLPTKALRGVVVAALIVLSVRPLVAHYQVSAKEGEDWRGAVDYVLQKQRADDGIVFLSRFGRRPFEYYLSRSNARVELVPIYPSMVWGANTPVIADWNGEATSAAAARLPTFDRVWAILLWEGFENGHQDGGPIRSVLETNFHVMATQEFGSELDVSVYERAPLR